jgi:hypothetical protein
MGVVVVFAAMLVAQAAPAQVTALQITGDSTRRLDLLILGDGYTAAEASKFANDVNQFLAGVFAQEPFREYRNYLNVRRIDTASAESGVDHPERTPPVSRNTAFDATYNCGGIQRLICISTMKALDAASVVPPSQRDLILMLVNDPEYGGSGGSIAVASTNVQVVELVLHETGHTLAFLADEYVSQPPPCADANEPLEVNATRDTSRASIKWRAWVDSTTAIPTTATTPGVPGVFVGSRYCPATLYRPTFDSKMRTLGRSYDAINTEQIVRRLYEFASPIDARSPAATTVTFTQGQSPAFSIVTPEPATHALTVHWQLNGQDAALGPSYTPSGLPPGTYTLTATVSDPTPLVRSDPNGVLRADTTWTLTITAGGPLTYALPPGGGSTASTSGVGGLTVGHAVLQPSTGAPSGLEIFRYRPNNITVTEAAVPATPRLSAGRFYAEVNGPLSTGIAISNPGAADAVVTFSLTDVTGAVTTSDSFVVPARGQIARFLHEAPFNAPPVFTGALTFTATSPVGAIALRGLTNARNEFLITTLPVVNLAEPAPQGPQVFSHFASGGGWTTTLALVNAGDTPLAGTLTFRSPDSGAPLTLAVDGQTASSFTYNVAARSARRLSTSGTGPLLSGSIQVAPTTGQPAPAGSLVFSFSPAGLTVSEAGVPAVGGSREFVLYAEASGSFGRPNSVQPGLALANTSSNAVTVSLELVNLQGQALGQGTLTVPANGQLPLFLNQAPGLAGVSVPYQGRLRVSAPSDITMVGLLGRYNERGDFLITTTPPIAQGTAVSTELVFPHFVDGDGYSTKLVFLNPQAQPAGGTLTFFSQSGQQVFPALQ